MSQSTMNLNVSSTGWKRVSFKWLSHRTAVFLGLIMGVYGLSYGVLLVQHPELIPNLFGVLSLLLYGFSLLPGIVKVVLPHYKSSQPNRWLLKYRRHIGVASFAFALTHSILIMAVRDISMMAPSTYVNYATGLVSFGIMIILTATSNDYSVKQLRQQWRLLHKLTYLLLIILPLHLWVTMKGDWSHLTPISIFALALIGSLFVRRFLLERQGARY